LLKSNFDKYRLLVNFGNKLKRFGEFKKAISIYSKAYELVDDLDNLFKLKILSNIGGAYSMIDKNNIAIKFMLRALKINPLDTITLVNLGIVHAKINKKDKAKFYFNEALKTRHDNKFRNFIYNWLERIE